MPAAPSDLTLSLRLGKAIARANGLDRMVIVGADPGTDPTRIFFCMIPLEVRAKSLREIATMLNKEADRAEKEAARDAR